MQLLQSNEGWNDQSVTIYKEGLGYFLGIAVEVSTNAIVIDFPPTHSPDLLAHEECTLAFSSSRRESSLKINAKVVSHRKDNDRCRVRFWIDHDTQMAISTLIEARGEYRISTSMKDPIVVAVTNEDDGVTIESVLENFSTMGFSLIAREVDAELLTPQGHLSLAFTIRSDPRPYRLTGVLRYSRPRNAFRQLGVEFQPSSDSEIRDSAGRFQQYVYRCQVAILADLAARQDPSRRAS